MKRNFVGVADMQQSQRISCDIATSSACSQRPINRCVLAATVAAIV